MELLIVVLTAFTKTSPRRVHFEEATELESVQHFSALSHLLEAFRLPLVRWAGKH
jgi:hypothetical protein